MTTKDAKKKFMSSVVKLGPDDCWEWVGSLFCYGYGQQGGLVSKFLGVGKLAHRISYKLFKGPIPEGLCVLHTCDNPPCVNPNHLWLGTHSDNVKDMLQKGRANPATGDRSGARTHPERLARGNNHGSQTHPERVPRGSKHYKAKVTPKIVRYIRRHYVYGGRWQLGSNRKELATKFSITPTQVYFIATHRSWKHIK